MHVSISQKRTTTVDGGGGGFLTSWLERYLITASRSKISAIDILKMRLSILSVTLPRALHFGSSFKHSSEKFFLHPMNKSFVEIKFK